MRRRPDRQVVRRPWRAAAVSLAVLPVVLAAGCGGDDPPPAADAAASTTLDQGTAPGTSDATTTTAPAADALVDAACAGRLDVRAAGRVDGGAGAELSGIVASRAHPGVLWVHDDSGAGPEVYAISEEGALLGAYGLGGQAIDWEDIAIAPDGDSWELVVGDIGDNLEARPSVTVHLVAEPDVEAPASAGTTTTESPATDPTTPVTLAPVPTGTVTTVTLTYPDRPHNAEAMLVDPTTGQLVIITKESTGPAQVFVAEGSSLTAGATVALTAAGTADFGGDGLGVQVTAADISPDGAAIAVRTYGGVHLFRRATGQTVAEALTTAPCEGPLPPEVQGEAVAFSADGRAVFTVSEGDEPLLHRTA